MRINEVEARVGISKKNIRFYEEEGLLKPSRTAENGYRDYSQADVLALQKIKLLRQLAVPLEEIRRLQTGSLTLQNCMDRQVLELEREAQNTLQIREVCGELAQHHESFESMDVPACEQRIAELERTGTRFMNVKNDRTRKMIGPVLITVVLSALMVAVEVLLGQALAVDPLPWFWAMLLLALPVIVAGGLIAALWLRVKEIRGGEEDAASQY